MLNDRIRSDEVARVADMLREALVAGVFRSGTRLHRQRLAEAVGTTVATVTAALRHLEHEGLVDFLHRRGAYVRAFSLSDVADLVAMRCLLEPYALQQAVPQLRADALYRAYMSIQEIQETEDWLSRERLADLFHLRIFVWAGRPRLLDIIATLRQESACLRAACEEMIAPRLPHAHYYDSLLKACAVGATETAMELLEQEIQQQMYARPMALRR